MFRFFFRKLLLVIPTFFGITLLAFSFIRLLPGDPILLLAGERGTTEERYRELTVQFGYDQPLPTQYFRYLAGIFQGDFGQSVVTKQPVLREFLTLFPATLELSLFAIAIAIGLGIPLGVFSALFKGRGVDQTIMAASLAGYSMPIFWWGLLMIILFSGVLGVTPVSGRISMLYFFEETTGFMLIDSLLSGESGAFLSALHHLVLPSVVLATIPLAVIARQSRSALIEVLGTDYVKTARSKGLGFGRTLFIHALRNALIPVVTTIGLQVGVLLTGAILTETIFSWPGIGNWIVHSIYRRDYPSVQGGLVLIAMIVMTVNLLVDFSYALINPQIRN